MYVTRLSVSAASKNKGKQASGQRSLRVCSDNNMADQCCQVQSFHEGPQ